MVRCDGRTHFGCFPSSADARPVLAPSCAVNGHSKSVDLKNLDASEVAWHLDFLRTEKGFRTSIKMKRHLTSRPSIQGPWTPTGVVMTDG